ncbi:Uncharacterised protein [Mycobacteroides abscessus subsp. abscessus]|nr:Uncharacterised protein [Mycobacteroides abscessus subsp. abscessus]
MLAPARTLDADARRTEQRPELTDEVLPFADADEVEELGLALTAELRRRHRRLRVLEVVPQVEVGEEVAAAVDETGVLLIGGSPHLGGTFTRILDGESRDDDEDLSPDTRLGAGDDHACEPRVDGQDRELPAGRSDPDRAGLVRLEGTEFGEQCAPVADGLGIGRSEEREAEDLLVARGESEVGHLEDDAGEVGAQDLRVGELGPGCEVGLRVEADADALARSARPSLALVRARLRDPLDRQPLHAGAVRIPGDPGGADVDDVLDAGHGQGGLGDVRGEHDARPGVRLEHLLLLAGGETGEERDDLPVAQSLRFPQVRLERVGSVADLPFPGEEDEDVTGILSAELVDG